MVSYNGDQKARVVGSARTQGNPGSKAMRPSRQALDSTAYGETRGGAMPSDDPIEGSCYYVRRQPGRLDWGLLHRSLDQQPDEDA